MVWFFKDSERSNYEEIIVPWRATWKVEKVGLVIPKSLISIRNFPFRLPFPNLKSHIRLVRIWELLVPAIHFLTNLSIFLPIFSGTAASAHPFAHFPAVTRPISVVPCDTPVLFGGSSDCICIHIRSSFMTLTFCFMTIIYALVGCSCTASRRSLRAHELFPDLSSSLLRAVFTCGVHYEKSNLLFWLGRGEFHDSTRQTPSYQRWGEHYEQGTSFITGLSTHISIFAQRHWTVFGKKYLHHHVIETESNRKWSFVQPAPGTLKYYKISLIVILSRLPPPVIIIIFDPSIVFKSSFSPPWIV